MSSIDFRIAIDHLINTSFADASSVFVSPDAFEMWLIRLDRLYFDLAMGCGLYPISAIYPYYSFNMASLGGGRLYCTPSPSNASFEGLASHWHSYMKSGIRAVTSERPLHVSEFPED